MGVRLDRADEPHAAPVGLLEVLLDRERRVDDDGFSRALVPHEVGRAPERVVDELREDHVRANVAAAPALLLVGGERMPGPHRNVGGARARTPIVASARSPTIADEPKARPREAVARLGRRDDGHLERPLDDLAVGVELVSSELGRAGGGAESPARARRSPACRGRRAPPVHFAVGPWTPPLQPGVVLIDAIRNPAGTTSANPVIVSSRSLWTVSCELLRGRCREEGRRDREMRRPRRRGEQARA